MIKVVWNRLCPDSGDGGDPREARVQSLWNPRSGTNGSPLIALPISVVLVLLHAQLTLCAKSLVTVGVLVQAFSGDGRTTEVHSGQLPILFWQGL